MALQNVPNPGGAGDDLGLLSTFFAGVNDGDTVVFPENATYVIKAVDFMTYPYGADQDITLSKNKVRIYGNDSKIQQFNNQKYGFLQLTGDDCYVSDITVEGKGTGDHARQTPYSATVSGHSVQSNPNFNGLNGLNRSCALYVTGGGNTFRNISAKDMFVCIHLRGPVDLSGTTYVWSRRADGNMIYNTSADGCDFVFTGSQQTHLTIEKFQYTNGTGYSAETQTHALYFGHSTQVSGGVVLSESLIEDSVISNFDVQGPGPDCAIKIKGFKNVTLSNFNIANMEGGISLDAGQTAVISNGAMNILSNSFGVLCTQVNGAVVANVTITGPSGANFTGVRSSDGSTNITAVNVAVTTNYSVAGAQSPFVAYGVYPYGDASLETVNCTHHFGNTTYVPSFRTIHSIVTQSYSTWTAGTPINIQDSSGNNIAVEAAVAIGKNHLSGATLVNYLNNPTNYDYKITTSGGVSQIELRDGPNLDPGQVADFTFHPVNSAGNMKVYKPAIDFPGTTPVPAANFLIDRACNMVVAVQTAQVENYHDVSSTNTVYDNKGGLGTVTKIIIP